MRYSLLWRTVLVVNFAKGTRRPLASAVSRILFGYGVATVLGVMLTPAVRQVDIPAGLPWLLIANLVVLIGFVLGGLISLTMLAAQSAKTRQATLYNILRLQPLPKRVRWLTRTLPSFLVIGMLGLCGGLLLDIVVRTAGYSVMVVVGFWLAGLASGYGLSLLTKSRLVLSKAAIYALLIAGAVMLLDQSLKLDDPRHYTGLAWLVNAICLMPLYGFWQSYRHSNSTHIESGRSTTLALIPQFVSAHSWFLVKVWRNARTRSALSLALLLNSLVAVVLVIRRIAPSDPHALLFIGAMLAATFAGDVRGVIRRHMPPEMVLVRGLRGMVWSEVRAVLLCGIVIGLPLLFALHRHADNSFLFLLFYLCLQSFAVMAGLLASTLFVPAAGEAGSQFFTGIAATGALVAFPKLAQLSQTSYAKQSAYWLLAGVLLGLGIYIIEIIRRKTYGRT